MEPVRYFYSTDGTDAHGPVTEEDLRQLVSDRVVRISSFLCREGETTWRVFDPDAFEPPIPIPRLPRYEPPPYVPTIQAKAKVEALVDELESKNDEGPFPGVLKWGCALLGAGTSIVLTYLQQDVYGTAISFVAALVWVGFLPFAISRIFPLVWRLRVCAIGMVGISTLTLLGQLEMSKIRHLEASIEALDAGVKDDAQKQIAAKGFYDGNIPQAESNLQKIKDESSQDSSEPARMLNAALGVSQVMVEKVKVSQVAEQACGSFDPAQLGSLVDLNTLRQNIGKLRATQVDVLTYFQNYDDHCRDALANGDFRADHVNQFIAGARQQGHIDQAVAIWQLKIKLSDDHLARLDFLDKHWGTWTPKDGKLIFSTEDDLTAYNGLTQNLINDVKTGRDLQNQVFH